MNKLFGISSYKKLMFVALAFAIFAGFAPKPAAAQTTQNPVQVGVPAIYKCDYTQGSSYNISSADGTCAEYVKGVWRVFPPTPACLAAEQILILVCVYTAGSSYNISSADGSVCAEYANGKFRSFLPKLTCATKF